MGTGGEVEQNTKQKAVHSSKKTRIKRSIASWKNLVRSDGRHVQ